MSHRNRNFDLQRYVSHECEKMDALVEWFELQGELFSRMASDEGVPKEVQDWSDAMVKEFRSRRK